MFSPAAVLLHSCRRSPPQLSPLPMSVERTQGSCVAIRTFPPSSVSRCAHPSASPSTHYLNDAACGTPTRMGKGLTCVCFKRKGNYEWICINLTPLQLLLDLHANFSAVTFHYGTSMDLIGAGSTPLHYAACGGNLKRCQILLARGASRLTLNCNGWLPLDPGCRGVIG